MVLPLVALVIVGLLQVARLGGESLAVVSAAREGARAAAVTSADDEVRRAALGAGLDPARAEVDVERGDGVGTPVTVRVSYRVSLAPEAIAWLLPPEVTLRARSTMRQETP